MKPSTIQFNRMEFSTEWKITKVELDIQYLVYLCSIYLTDSIEYICFNEALEQKRRTLYWLNEDKEF